MVLGQRASVHKCFVLNETKYSEARRDYLTDPSTWEAQTWNFANANSEVLRSSP